MKCGGLGLGLQCSAVVLGWITVQCGSNDLDCSEVRWYWAGLQCSAVVLGWITVQCGGNGSETSPLREQA